MKFMDQLFQRYADPFSLITGYIQTSRFSEFVRMFCAEKMESDRWEFFLHKVWDKSYTEFTDALTVAQDHRGMSDAEMEATVQKSMNILGNFNPQQEEGENVNGTI